jgi:chitinase
MFVKFFSFLFIFLYFINFVTCEYARPCYFTDWAHYRQGKGKYEPESYIPGICTHIFFAFAKINSDFTAAAFDPEDLADWNGNANGGYYAKVNALKQKQPGLKTILSFGGWSAGTALFKQMAASSQNRQKFVQSAVAFFKKYNFDGIDIDWEYPEADDKANYAQFMKELKSAAGSLLVTAAVTAAPEKIDIGYDVPALAQSLDFVNVMTYDFHGGWEQVTGENSPLYPAPGDTTNWNTNFAMKYWAKKGMPKNKLLVGIAAYGRGWTLNDSNNHGIGAPGQSAPGLPITNTQGFAAYYEICNLGGTRYWDNNQKVPYNVNGKLWYGYDDVQSVGLKAQWIKDNGFGGAFVWTLDFDDFNGQCSGGKLYPILNTIKDVLGGGSPPTYAPPPTFPTTTTKSPPTGQTQKPITQNPNDPFKCPSPNGFFSDPKDCTSYYECNNGNPIHFTCPPGTEWNEKLQTCDWPSDTVCFQKKSVKSRSVKKV